MTQFEEIKEIRGAVRVRLQAFEDGRGRFCEIFRKEWFPETEWLAVQSNYSESNAGVLRGLHYHRKQSDYWYVIHGRIRAALVDLRQSSASFKASATIELSHREPIGLYIPVGVAHGFAAIEHTRLLYIVDNYYDGDDEFGIAWNDREFDLDWGLDTPVISERDLNNPTFSELLIGDLPR